MLSLSREPREAILIGDDIRIVVFSIGRGKVQLGVQAPKHIKIFRAELLEAMEKKTPSEVVELDPRD